MVPRVLSCLIVGALVSLAAASDAAVVWTDKGYVSGAYSSSYEWHYFGGIPYAAPPTGSLRWQPPADKAPWGWILDNSGTHTNRTGYCPTWNADTQNVEGDEDCLYLDIVTTTLSQTANKPVLVWIHGGFYNFGDSASFIASPKIVYNGVVLVSIDYRLGALGFMAHPELTSESPVSSSGNYGIYDQIAALEWVETNIHRFGGDPNNVTIVGESAGGGSVMALLASPLAAGLFDKAIIMSAGNHVDTLAVVEERGERWAADMGCPAPTTPACLRSLSTSAVVENQPTWQEAFDGGDPYGPAIDDYLLADVPIALVDAGVAADVPLMIGSTSEEMGIYADMLSEATVTQYLLDHGYSQAEIDSFEAYYRANDTDTSTPWQVDVATDAIFVCASRDFAMTAEAAHQSPVYHYTYNYYGPYGWTPPWHSYELIYLFPDYYVAWDNGVSSHMRWMWSTFAATGTPYRPWEWWYGYYGWPTYQPSSGFKSLEIQYTLAQRTDFRGDKCDLLGL